MFNNEIINTYGCGRVSLVYIIRICPILAAFMRKLVAST